MKEVVCINNSDQTQIKCGMTYKTDIIAQCKCGKIIYGLVGIDNYAKGKNPNLHTLCTCGRKLDYNGKHVFDSCIFTDVKTHCI